MMVDAALQSRTNLRSNSANDDRSGGRKLLLNSIPVPIEHRTSDLASSRLEDLPIRKSHDKLTRPRESKTAIPSEDLKSNVIENDASNSFFERKCSVAMCRTESILVSSAGDVIVCRCRRSSTPFIPPKARTSSKIWDKQFPCCNTDNILSNIDEAWSPTAIDNSSTRNRREHTSSASQISFSTDFSGYEWEKAKSDTVNDNANSSVVEISSSSRDDHGNGKRNGDNHDDEHPATNQYDVYNTNLQDSTSPSDRLDYIAIDESIVSLPSFDNSHIIDGHNDMVPNMEGKHEDITTLSRSPLEIISKRGSSRSDGQQADSARREKSNLKSTFVDEGHPQLECDQIFFHGVPLFLSTLSQVTITKVSANPLGAHVLMISQEALLFTYGLNNRGQLGIGFKSETGNPENGFRTSPTLITPLLENGGKAINCAAGVDHSLVVIARGGRRLKSRQTSSLVGQFNDSVASLSSPKQSNKTTTSRQDEEGEGSILDEKYQFSETSVQYHQVYAFGRNNFMKLGLIRPHRNDANQRMNSTDDVVLPRRVGLQCIVLRDILDASHSSFPPWGVFDIAASKQHSSALVRRQTGDVEVYMWGNASLGALGIPLDLQPQQIAEIRGEVGQQPALREEKIFPLPTLLESLCYRRAKNPTSPFPIQLSLGPHCSFYVMSNGKCLSTGFSAEGMLGHGYNKTLSFEPEVVHFPSFEAEQSNRIVSISAGALHVLALSDDGQVFSWGTNSHERLGLGSFDYASIDPSVSDKYRNIVVIEWFPKRLDIETKLDGSCRRGQINRNRNNRISLACAGYDCSILVMESGKVLSFGKRSGRLGKGEAASNVNTPEPLYGGLHLFRPRNDCLQTSVRVLSSTLCHRSISTSAIE